MNQLGSQQHNTFVLLPGHISIAQRKFKQFSSIPQGDWTSIRNGIVLLFP